MRGHEFNLNQRGNMFCQNWKLKRKSRTRLNSVSETLNNEHTYLRHSWDFHILGKCPNLGSSKKLEVCRCCVFNQVNKDVYFTISEKKVPEGDTYRAFVNWKCNTGRRPWGIFQLCSWWQKRVFQTRTWDIYRHPHSFLDTSQVFLCFNLTRAKARLCEKRKIVHFVLKGAICGNFCLQH